MAICSGWHRRILIVLILLLVSGKGFAQAPEPLILNTQQWPPFEWEKDGKQGGFAVQIVRCVFSKLNRPVEIRFLPWTRAQFYVENGEADGFFPASRSAGRDAYAVRSEPIISVNWVWFTRKDENWDARSTEFKRDAKVAAERGSYYGKWLEQNGYNLVAQPDTHAQMALMLEKNRIDGFLANDLVLFETVGTNVLEQKNFTATTVKSDPLGVYFSKNLIAKNPLFLEEFNSFLAECR